MSRIGRSPITVPAGVEITIDENNHVTVKGPKGTLERTLAPQMKIDVDAGVITVSRPNDNKENRSLHGLTRTLIANMIEGVTNGFKKELQVQGVGYKVLKDGARLVMNIGYSHQVIVEENDDIKIDAPAPNTIIISGIDKQKVGQFAADVRKKRPPEPYKGKGIRYANEVVRHKEGKTGAKK
jgi:large subunit ribosomal protein L6